MPVEGLIPAHAGKTVFLRSQEGNRRAHPRSRGENGPTEKIAHNAQGSSPLTRGKRGLDLVRGVEDRLIPAHAGKTRFLPGGHGAPEAHPRSRGENAPKSVPSSWYSGSSPLTRGKLFVRFRRVFQVGLIPAHAGKTMPGEVRRIRHRAHPRSRGENWSWRVQAWSVSGSSPLTRGKPPPWGNACTSGGLIPAHAGKTRRSLGSLRTGWAHPRSRGENTVTVST